MIGLFDTSAGGHGPLLLGGLAALGFVVGILTGLFGVGGAIVITPMLNVMFGMPYAIAVGSSLSFTIGTSVGGWVRNMRLGNVALKTMTILAGASIFGTILGADVNGLIQTLPDRYEVLLMHGLFMGVLLLTAGMVARGAARERSGPSLLQRLPGGPRIHIRAANLQDVSLIGLCLVGLIIGMAKGIMGIGGGVLFMPILMSVVGLTARQAVGTSLGIVLFSSVAGTVVFGMKGSVDLWVVMALLAGSTIGVQLGVWLCQKLHAQRLQRYFAIFLLVVLAVLAWDFVRKLGA